MNKRTLELLEQARYDFNKKLGRTDEEARADAAKEGDRIERLRKENAKLPRCLQ